MRAHSLQLLLKRISLGMIFLHFPRQMPLSKVLPWDNPTFWSALTNPLIRRTATLWPANGGVQRQMPLKILLTNKRISKTPVAKERITLDRNRVWARQRANQLTTRATSLWERLGTRLTITFCHWTDKPWSLWKETQWATHDPWHYRIRRDKRSRI